MKLRLASYNLHKCRGMTGPRNPARNLSVIQTLAPDIIALQEVDHRLGTRPEALPRQMIEAATGLCPADFWGTGMKSLGWHGQTILLRADLAQQAMVRRLPLPGLEPRGALALRLPGLTVVAVHLGLTRTARRAQLQRIIEKASRIGDGEIALLGDFNEWSQARGLEPLGGFHLLTPGRSWPAPAPQLCLDRIVLSRGISVTASGVFDNDEARRASDHLPIWADVEVSRPKDHAVPPPGVIS